MDKEENREIKFLAWDKLGKRMCHLISISYSSYNLEEKNDKCEIFWENGMFNESVWREANEVILLQFTGFKDKNGKDIYEGDICKWEEMSGIIELEKKGFVRFDGGRFEVGNHNGYGGSWDDLGILLQSYWNNKKEHDTFEVIGNIYENKELLE